MGFFARGRKNRIDINSNEPYMPAHQTRRNANDVRVETDYETFVGLGRDSALRERAEDVFGRKLASLDTVVRWVGHSTAALRLEPIDRELDALSSSRGNTAGSHRHSLFG